MKYFFYVIAAAAFFLFLISANTLTAETAPPSVQTETSNVSKTESSENQQQKQTLSSITEQIPWWGWALLLFLFTFILGILAVVAGVGGGVLFVPIVGAFFPFGFDFVRGAGLIVALTGAISASPRLIEKGMANLKLAIPLALVGSIFSILGAMAGLALPTRIVQTALGVAILGIVVLMVKSKRSTFPHVPKSDNLSSVLGIYGIYYEETENTSYRWKIHRTPIGLLLFVGIGFLAGMFGLGAGWANVPVLNLLLGAPVKVSVATSMLILSINDTAAAWVYFMKGAILPLIVVPSVVGMMLGTRIGARLLSSSRPLIIRRIVITFLLLAGIRSLLVGFGI